MLKVNTGIKPLLIGLSVAFLLSACASTPEECDPRQDQGFFGKIGCAVTGSYEQRVTTKEEQVASLQAENKRLNELIREINAKDALVRGDYATRQRELDQVKADLYSLQSKLAQKKALNNELQQKFDQANAQLVQMQSAPASTSIAEKERQISELEATLDELSTQMLEGI